MSPHARRLLAGDAHAPVILDEAAIEGLIDAAEAAGGRVAELHGPIDKTGLLAAIGAGLRYPDWWGRNWDALAEMLSFPEPTEAGGALRPDVPEVIVWRDPAALAEADAGAWEVADEVLREAIADRRGRGAAPLVVAFTGDLPLEIAGTPAPGARTRLNARAEGGPTGEEAAATLAALPAAIRRVGRVHHIAVIVREMDAALRFWRDILGLAPGPVVPIPSDRVNIAFLPVGEVKIELVEPTDDTTGVARFLARKGEGVHHVCFEVPDISAALARVAIDGVELIDSAPRPGAEGPVAFLHPRSCHGVLVELIEAEGGPAWASLYPDGFRAPEA